MELIPAKLNYNRFLDEMHFIDIRGDTLNIANAGTIKFIRINVDVFYYDNGYVKFIKDTDDIKLASKQTLVVSGRNKIGAYGMANPTSAIDSYGTLHDQKKQVQAHSKRRCYTGKKNTLLFWR